ncbi:hypothetical protein Achl_4085 (plasmid) [Pseudarthrobacter chlorophenolicus A6]|uniref:Uncharacterized protein n=1 Tax=Pseudarthrobacter chlorophenolicus (strain ATCC 700700 / DSM 12829 / CIP 107037 / JCM 12360 / KCTC 9906 / NCIMB 13794 / A6) TaxID=452863 RepID=B8HHY9_PSECP|nr:hypothetical protein [Pseudarthrobacter chlorophenolicus]ACL42036.1 hypothetical protein Achl_4085 [Pseudarthrobacter chlorophenolicus A6]SDQ20638.1 hypothetical protein SAMN04489738_0735 [Pseudarthrobacter chlorophenolicus]
MNRALAVAVRHQLDSGALQPGDLDRALRDGRVTLSIGLKHANGETDGPDRTHEGQ